MSTEYEKRDEPVTFRTSGRKAAWLNDVARVRSIDRSFLCDEIITNFLECQERVRTPEYRTREIEEAVNNARAALDAAVKSFGMVYAGKGSSKRKVS